MRPVLAALLCLLASSVSAQVDPSLQLVECKYRNVEIRDVLSDLLGKVGLSFSMDTKIRGRLSANLSSMPFEEAFQTILESCWLTYRGGGIYEIIRQERSVKEQERIDAHPGSLILSTGPPDDLAPAFTARRERADNLLWRVLSNSGKSFVIGIGFDSTITADIPAQQLGRTLARIAQRSHARLSYRSGVWVLSGPYPWRLVGPPPPQPESWGDSLWDTAKQFLKLKSGQGIYRAFKHPFSTGECRWP